MQFITILAQCQLCYIALQTVKMCDNWAYLESTGKGKGKPTTPHLMYPSLTSILTDISCL